MTDTTTDWRDRALCLTVHPNVMQPERATEAEVRGAKAVCAGCPVRDDCLTLAESQQSATEAYVTAYGVHAGEWWGPDPVWEVERVCELDGCEVLFRTERDGNRQARFCSAKHRVAAARSREHCA